MSSWVFYENGVLVSGLVKMAMWRSTDLLGASRSLRECGFWIEIVRFAPSCWMAFRAWRCSLSK